MLSVPAPALGTATFVRDLRMLRARWAGFEFSAIAAPFPTAELPPPPAYPPKLKATAPHVLPLRDRGRVLFNGAIVGMRGEPVPAARNRGTSTAGTAGCCTPR